MGEKKWERLEPTFSLEDERLEAFKQIVPEAFADGKVAFDSLRELLGDTVEESDEHFGLNWPGKREARRLAGMPSKGTLVPVPGKGINEDTTENIFIEGDNLEVLKLLHKSYRGRIKMIYIDPPYNTGNDFIYKDDYRMPLESYLQRSGQKSDMGELLTSNPKSSGRFHSDWLNMMYPRLRVAKDLLRGDGVIFVSIDDNEIHNLRQMMNELFGEENFVETFIWEKKKKPAFLDKSVGGVTEYILCFCRDTVMKSAFSVDTTTAGKKYPLNNAGNTLATLTFPPGSVKFGMKDQSVPPQDMSEGNIVTELLDRIEISNGTNKSEFRLKGEWRYSQNKLNEIVEAEDTLTISKIPFRPNHVKKGGEPKKMKNLLSIAHYKVATYEDATAEVESIFGASLFDYAKPSGLVELLTRAASEDDDIILDFFAGSGTTAQAVTQANKDGGNRRFICIQLDAPIEATERAAAAGFKTISELAAERIRRVSTDFEFYRLQHSNLKAWSDYVGNDLDELRGLLQAQLDSTFVDGATEDAIVIEILLLEGFPLTSKIKIDETFQKNAVRRISHEWSEHRLFVTLDKEIQEETIRTAEELEKADVFICLDNALTDRDKVRIADVCHLKTL